MTAKNSKINLRKIVSNAAAEVRRNNQIHAITSTEHINIFDRLALPDGLKKRLFMGSVTRKQAIKMDRLFGAHLADFHARKLSGE